MATLDQLESKLNDVFVKQAPPLPDNGKKFIVDYAPWITLIGGILMLVATLSLWRGVHAANTVVNYAHEVCTTYALDDCGSINRLTAWIWLTLLIMLVEAVLYILAYPALRDRKKQGWNLVFYVALINIVLAVVNLLNNYSGVGSFLGNLIGSAIGLYLLFQVRSFYLAKTAKTVHTASK